MEMENSVEKRGENKWYLMVYQDYRIQQILCTKLAAHKCKGEITQQSDCQDVT